MSKDDSKHNPGPDPERLKIDGDWEDAVKHAMGKPKPAEGWPDPEPEGVSFTCKSCGESQKLRKPMGNTQPQYDSLFCPGCGTTRDVEFVGLPDTQGGTITIVAWGTNDVT